MTAQFAFETKSQLAKLLATENITIQHNAAVKTAYFDIRRRLLVLPVWQGISEDLYDMLVVHEVGHALDTPEDEWMAGIDAVATHHHKKPSDRIKGIVKDFLNVVEDARIDKLQKRRYPGSRKNYVKGYAELFERDFFKIRGKDINALSFIDRANIYFKGGIALGIKFSAIERAFIVRMENAETFQDVVNIASDVYGYSRTTEKEDRQAKQQALEESLKIGVDDDGDESGEEVWDDEVDLEEGVSSDDGSDEAESDDGSDGVQSDGDNAGSSSDDVEEETEYVPEVETEAAARDNASTIVSSDDTDYFYIDLPKMKHELIVDEWSVVAPQMIGESHRNAYWFGDEARNFMINELTEWKTKEKDTISFMVKEFEMKKAADAYARTSVSKTGVLDTNKIHSYRYNEDIFRKVATTLDGKNHGFVMFLDWSSSMSLNLKHTLKQLFGLIMFCKRVQIPFEVYLFREPCRSDNMDIDIPQYENTSNDGIVFDTFKIRNILSSKMPLNTLNKMMEALWISCRKDLATDSRNSTPLNQCLLAADHLVNQFRKRNKVQVVSTVILTDGASDPIRFSRLSKKTNVNYIFRDTVTKKTYHVSKTNFQRNITSTFLRVLKDRTQSNLIGFYLSSYSITRLLTMGLVDRNSSATLSSWRDDSFVASSSVGYDEYYIINTKKLSDDAQGEMNIDSSMSKSRVAKAFMKYSNKKVVNRVLLSKFITRISKDELSKKSA